MMEFPTVVRVLPIAVLLLSPVGCNNAPAEPGVDGGSTANGSDTSSVPLSAEEVEPVARAYADLVLATYDDAITSAQALDSAVLAFTANPSEDTHEAAQMAWLAARESYGQSEGFRFYDGPIDNADGPEGQINAWPMDEAYVDYVEGQPQSGIINDPSITLTVDMLTALNEQGGEENVATGYHAIEFLLWGQDLNDAGPGTRSFEDFVDGGPVPNADRRRQYLELVSALLITDLQAVREQWTDGDETYRAQFLSLAADDSVQNILRGIGALAAAELSEERMNVAYDTKLQEDEHSCFSDNTHNDILYNFLSIANVYHGDYGALQGPGIDTLVEARDPALAQTLADQLRETEDRIRAIPAPFDQSIQGDDTSEGRIAIAEAVDSLRELGDRLVEVARLLELTLNTSID